MKKKKRRKSPIDFIYTLVGMPSEIDMPHQQNIGFHCWKLDGPVHRSIKHVTKPEHETHSPYNTGLGAYK